MQTKTPPILLIYGPTASGKSALAVHLAQRFGGEVINADSMQVYAGLPVLTAQPDTQDRGGVPHHLYGWRDAAAPCSAGIWQQAALAAIEDVQKRGAWPILVGGTGLYLQTLTSGLAEIPPIGKAARARTEALLQRDGLDGLRAALGAIDPEAARRIQGADKQRLVRAHAVYVQTGKPLSAWQAQTRPALPPGSWTGLVLLPERERLRTRIAERFALMLERGALEEARAMAARRLDDSLPAMKALGLPPLLAHLQGRISLDEASAQAIADTRRYAKRQRTWARGRFGDWPVIDAASGAEQARAALEHFPKSGNRFFG